MSAATVHQRWRDADLVGEITIIEVRCCVPVHACNDTHEICALVLFLGSAARRKHVVGQVTDVVALLVVGFKKCLDMPQVAPDYGL